MSKPRRYIFTFMDGSPTKIFFLKLLCIYPCFAWNLRTSEANLCRVLAISFFGPFVHVITVGMMSAGENRSAHQPKLGNREKQTTFYRSEERRVGKECRSR